MITEWGYEKDIITKSRGRVGAESRHTEVGR